MTKLAVVTDTPQMGQIYETQYGPSAPVTERDGTLVFAHGHADPRATVRALKDQGVTHLWLCESAGALSPLLQAGDWLVVDDYIDGTRGQHYTYFSEKAGGYVQQVPPFDQASREALLTGLETVTERPFQRGVYVCVSNTRLETPAEAQFWSRAGGHVVGRFLSPTLMLARELEISIAALVRVTRVGGTAADIPGYEIYAPVIKRAWEHFSTGG